MLFLVTGFNSLVDEIIFMLISRRSKNCEKYSPVLIILVFLTALLSVYYQSLLLQQGFDKDSSTLFRISLILQQYTTGLTEELM